MEQTPLGHPLKSQSVVETPFVQLLSAARVAHASTFFADKADRTTVTNWKAGRRNPPQWAIDRLRTEIRRHHAREQAIADSVLAGPGRQSGLIPGAGLRRIAERRA